MSDVNFQNQPQPQSTPGVGGATPQTPTEGTTKKETKAAKGQDVLTQAPPVEGKPGVYSTDVNRPVLSQPKPGADLTMTLNQVPLKERATPDQLFGATLTTQLRNYFMENPTVDPKVIAAAALSTQTGEEARHPEARVLTGNLHELARRETVSGLRLPKEWTPGKTGQAKGLQEGVQTLFREQINNQIGKLAQKLGVTTQQLKFALNGGRELTPQESKLLEQGLKEVKKNVREMLQLPNDWKPEGGWKTEDNGAFLKDLKSRFEHKFGQALEQFAKQKGLTDEDVAKLKFARFYPDVKFDGSEKFQEMAKEVEGQFASQFAEEEGFAGSDFDPSTRKVYDGVLASTYDYDFKRNLGKYAAAQEPPLTQEQIKVITEASRKKDLSKLPPQVAKAVKAVRAKTLDGMADFGIPPGWIPPKDVVDEMGRLDPVAKAMIQNAFGFADDVTDSAQQIVMNLPPGAGRNSAMDFLKIVLSALQTAKTSMYAMENSDAAIARENEGAKYDMQMNKIHKMQEQIKEQAKQLEKKKKFGIVSKILGPILKVFSLVLAVATGGIAGGIVAGLLIANQIYAGVSDKQGGFLKEMFKGVTDGIVDGLKDVMPKKVAEAIAATVELVMVAAFTLVSIGASAGLASIQLFFSLFTQSDAIGEYTKAAGGDKKAQEIAQMTVTLVLAVTTIVLTTVATFGAGLAAEAPIVAEEGAEGALSATDRLMNGMRKFAQISRGFTKFTSRGALEQIEDPVFKERLLKLIKVGQIGQGVAQTANYGNEVGLSIVEAQGVEQNAKAAEQIAFDEAMIKILTQVINSILQAVSGSDGETIKQITDIQSGIVNSMSSVVSRATGALEA